MAIEINGKIYRNIQEQVEKNKDDIEDLQTDVTNLQNEDSILDGKITAANTRIDNILKAEDEDYKTQLVFEPDDAYLEYYDKDPENPEDFRWGLVQKCFEIQRLTDRHLYAHNVQLTVKFKSQGVTSNTYTGRVNLTLYLPTSTQLTEETLKQRIGRAIRVSATGYAIDTVYEYNYTIIALVKYSDLISTELEVDLIPTNNYAASGLVSAVIGEITDFTDKVVTII